MSIIMIQKLPNGDIKVCADGILLNGFDIIGTHVRKIKKYKDVIIGITGNYTYGNLFMDSIIEYYSCGRFSSEGLFDTIMKVKNNPMFANADIDTIIVKDNIVTFVAIDNKNDTISITKSDLNVLKICGIGWGVDSVEAIMKYNKNEKLEDVMSFVAKDCVVINDNITTLIIKREGIDERM